VGRAAIDPGSVVLAAWPARFVGYAERPVWITGRRKVAPAAGERGQPRVAVSLIAALRGAGSVQAVFGEPRKYPWSVSYRPGAVQGVQTVPTGGRVEYQLARNAVVREFHRGRLSRLDVCDAHPELLRAARNLGRSMGDPCPICEEASLVDVTYVFGPRLPSGGRCVATEAELARFRRRKDPVVCYVVEVCTGCSWNHLLRMFPTGSGVDSSSHVRVGSGSGSGNRGQRGR